jgi:hypothetical protein
MAERVTVDHDVVGSTPIRHPILPFKIHSSEGLSLSDKLAATAPESIRLTAPANTHGMGVRTRFA